MKKYILLLLCLCLLLSGCAAPGPLPAHTPPSVSTETVTQHTKAEDGTLLLERSYPRFTLTIGDHKITQTIARDLQSRIDGWMALSADLEGYALGEYTAEMGWTKWFARLESQITRLDSQVFSLFFEYSEFTGGNHPSQVTYSVTYDCTTGQALELDQLLTEGYTVPLLSVFVNANLASQAENLYDDYEALVGKAFTDGDIHWYLSEEGLCFHFAPYDIGPYSSGTVTAVIPYEQLSSILQEQYLPA